MEKLELKLEDFEEGLEEEVQVKQEPSYHGLRLIESKTYMSGTSIKYWM